MDAFLVLISYIQMERSRIAADALAYLLFFFFKFIYLSVFFILSLYCERTG